MNKSLVLFLLSLSFSASPLSAEVRIWEDKNGNRYEAEFVRELFDKITIRDLNGREHRLVVEDLSEHDQKYIRVMIPPQLEIDQLRKSRFKPKPKELSDSDDDITVLLKSRVRIRKISKRPSTTGLKAEIYFIAEEIDGENYILLDRFESGFHFAAGDMHEFTTKEIEYGDYQAITKQRRGEKYIGYLIAVSDAQSSNLIQVKTDINWLADKVEKLRELYFRGKASRFVRHFDKNIERTEVPRPRYVGGRPEPRRKFR